jgi:outer membrane protein assembly factor BamB
VHDGVLYVATDSGVLSTYDAGTGERLYQVRMGEGVSSFSASPVAAGRIYFASEDGTVYVVRAGRTYELLATNMLDAVTLATPAIIGNLLIVRTKSETIALGTP